MHINCSGKRFIGYFGYYFMRWLGFSTISYFYFLTVNHLIINFKQKIAETIISIIRYPTD